VSNAEHYQRRLGTVEQELRGAKDALRDRTPSIEHATKVLADEIEQDADAGAEGKRMLSRLGEIAKEVAALKKTYE